MKYKIHNTWLEINTTLSYQLYSHTTMTKCGRSSNYFLVIISSILFTMNHITEILNKWWERNVCNDEMSGCINIYRKGFAGSNYFIFAIFSKLWPRGTCPLSLYKLLDHMHHIIIPAPLFLYTRRTPARNVWSRLSCRVHLDIILHIIMLITTTL